MRAVLELISLSLSPLRPTICQKLQTELICGFTKQKQLHALQATMKFVQCMQLLLFIKVTVKDKIMSESERESIRVPSPPLLKKIKSGSVIITNNGYKTSKE